MKDGVEIYRYIDTNDQQGEGEEEEERKKEKKIILTRPITVRLPAVYIWLQVFFTFLIRWQENEKWIQMKKEEED